MMKRNGFLIFALLLISTFLFAQDDGQPPTFVPVPVSETLYESSPIDLEIIVNDQSAIAEVYLFYRFSPAENYSSVRMQLDVNYIARIPAIDVQGGTLFYYVLARDEHGNQATWPEAGERQPATVRIEPVGQVTDRVRSDVVIELLSPDPEAEPEEDFFPILLSLYDPNQAIDLATLELYVNGQSVTNKATLSREMISYMPERAYPPGENVIGLRFRDRSGTPYQKRYVFAIGEREKIEIAAAEKKSIADAINLQVNFGLDTDYDKFSGKKQPDNRPIDTHRLNARLKFDLGPVKFSASALLNTHVIDDNATELDKRRQPLNRLRVDIQSPILDIAYGDYTPEFSHLTMRGTRVRGLSTQLKLGWWKTTYLQGETKQLVTPIIREHPDSTTWRLIHYGVADSIYVDHERGTPTRQIQGLRTEMDFFRHFNIGISGFKAYDEIESLQLPYDDLQEKYAILGNVVGGMDATLHLNHDRTILRGELAFSMANDILGSDSLLIDESGLEQDQVDNIAEFLGFQLTDDMILGSAEGRGLSVPLPDMDRLDESGYFGDYLLEDVVKNGTYRIEFRTPIPLKILNLDVLSEYQRIPANFNSFANAALRTDYQGSRTQLRARLFKNQVSLSGGVENYHDNVAGDTRPQTTHTNSVSGGFGLNFAKLPTINYSIRTMLRNGELPAGTVEQEDGITLNDNATVTHTISPAYRFSIKETSVNLSGNLMLMDYSDNNATALQNPNFQSNSLTGALSVNFKIPLSFMLGGGRSVNAPEDELQTSTTFSLMSGKLSYKFLDNKISSYLGFNMVKGSKPANGVWDSGEDFDDLNGNAQWDAGEPFYDLAGIDNSKFTLKVGAQARLIKNLSMNLSLDQINVQDFLDDSKNYQELRIKFRLNAWL